jgi:polyribonucleotide nucleotidyltransferase
MSRIGFVESDGSSSYVINPHFGEDVYSELDLIVTTRKDKVVMIETEAEQLSEDVVLKGMEKAIERNNEVIDFIEKFRKKVGKEKEEVAELPVDKEILDVLKKNFKKKIEEFNMQMATKEGGGGELMSKLLDEVAEKVGEEADMKEVAKAFDYYSKQLIREYILDNKKRLDGREPDEIRPLASEVSILPRTHGTGLFQRGETQALSIATLGAPNLSQLIESPEGETAKRYMHHYYMPPYSVGETGRIGFPSRREIGHGALAEKAIVPVLPSEKEFPYSIRVVSEVLSSNGSTSMASTCGSTLALMDAGVPIKAPVAGIAIGILTRSDDDYVILTDIMGIEDFSGDMDFKVAGTESGITAIQLDVKNDGLTIQMIEEVLNKAKTARMNILDVMNSAIEKPRTEVSEYAPKIVVLHPPTDKIGEIIGPGGRTIRSLIAKTQTEINIDDYGEVTITGLKKDHVDAAVSEIENMVREVEVGETFEGTVRRILPFGAFVEILPGKEGLVHVSKMADRFIKDPKEIVDIDDVVNVEVIQIDDQGRINLKMNQDKS